MGLRFDRRNRKRHEREPPSFLSRLFRRINYPGRPRQGPGFFPSFPFFLPPHPSQDSRPAPPLFLVVPSRSESSRASQTQRAAAMASPDAEQAAPTEPARWRDLDMLLSRPGNLVAASFDPSPTVRGLAPRRRVLRFFLVLYS